MCAATPGILCGCWASELSFSQLDEASIFLADRFTSLHVGILAVSRVDSLAVALIRAIRSEVVP